MRYKSFPARWKATGTEGEIEAWVSVYDNVDSYGDRVKYGAFASSLSELTPALIWQHKMDTPIGITTSMEEVPAGDPRLPDEIKANGGLLAKGLLNLNVQAGREAYEHVKFGSVNQYSFGYDEVLTTPLPDGTKELNKLKLYEWSLVTLGANPKTQTQSVKEMGIEDKLATLSALVDNAEEHAHAFADMKLKAGRVLNSRIRGMIASLADQLTDAAKSLYALHKETDPTPETANQRRALLLHLQLLNQGTRHEN